MKRSTRSCRKKPAEALDSETLGLLAAIGIEHGKPFAPDARMKKILTEAVPSVRVRRRRRVVHRHVRHADGRAAGRIL